MIEPTKEDLGRPVVCGRRLDGSPAKGDPESDVVRWTTEEGETLMGFTASQIFTKPGRPSGRTLPQFHVWDRLSGADRVEWAS